MANVRIQQLPEDLTPVDTDVVAVDSTLGGTTRRVPLPNLADQIRPIASQAEAEAAANNTKGMSSLRTKQQIDARLADQATMEAGVDNVDLATSLGVKQQIAVGITVVGTAGYWADDATAGRQSVVGGRTFFNTSYTGNRLAPLGGSWGVDLAANYFAKNAQLYLEADYRFGGVFMSRSGTGFAASAMGVAGVAFVEDSAAGRAGYFEIIHNSTIPTNGIEIQGANLTGVTPVVSPYSMGSSGPSGLLIAAQGRVGYELGDDNTPASTSSAPLGAAIDIAGGEQGLANQKYVVGISFRNGGLVRDGNDHSNAIQLARGHQLAWFVSGTDVGAVFRSDVTIAAQNVAAIFQNAQITLGGVGERAIVKAVDDLNGAGAVNWLELRNSRTNIAVEIRANGSDTNASLALTTKGTGITRFMSHAGSGESLRITPPSSAPTDYVTIAGSAGLGIATIGAAGASTNIDLALNAKGTGLTRFGTFTASADAAVNGYVTIKDSGGTTRKLATIP